MKYFLFSYWLEKYRKYSNNKAFYEGFRWASEQLISRKSTVTQLENYVQCAKDFDDYQEFDKGVSCAITNFNNIIKAEAQSRLESVMSEKSQFYPRVIENV